MTGLEINGSKISGEHDNYFQDPERFYKDSIGKVSKWIDPHMLWESDVPPSDGETLVILMKRPPRVIAESQSRFLLFFGGPPMARGQIRKLADTLKVDQLKLPRWWSRHGYPVFPVDFNLLVTDPERVIRELGKEFGLDVDKDELDALTALVETRTEPNKIRKTLIEAEQADEN